MLQCSGVSAPPPVAVVVTPPDTSLSGSLRLTLSRDPKRTREPEHRLMSGDVSDRPGRSSALVGVTVKRTDAMAAHLKKLVGEGRGTVWDAGKEGWGRRNHRLASSPLLT